MFPKSSIHVSLGQLYIYVYIYINIYLCVTCICADIPRERERDPCNKQLCEGGGQGTMKHV